MALRTEFPEAGEDYMGGYSDGWEYRTVFAGRSLEATYAMIRQFLAEEGYADVPLPADVEELKCFLRKRKGRQIALFEETGYVHNPIKILVAVPKRLRFSLVLCVYNEQSPGHLVRFHRVE